MNIFETILGFKVSLSKFCMAGIHVEEQWMIGLVSVLKCKVGEWIVIYLGFPLGGYLRSISFWDLVVEKVSKKFACLKKS